MINNDGNYEPGNCRWATPAQQNRNRSVTKFTEETVKIARHLYRRGVNPAQIASIFKVTYNCAWNMCRKFSWQDV